MKPMNRPNSQLTDHEILREQCNQCADCDESICPQPGIREPERGYARLKSNRPEPDRIVCNECASRARRIDHYDDPATRQIVSEQMKLVSQAWKLCQHIESTAPRLPTDDPATCILPTGALTTYMMDFKEWRKRYKRVLRRLRRRCDDLQRLEGWRDVRRVLKGEKPLASPYVN